MNVLKNVIPIVFASDNRGASYIFTSIVSIASNKSLSSFIDIYILVSENFTNKNKTIIQSIEGKYQDIKINFIDMGKNFDDIRQNISHITTPTYYRLEIAEVLPLKYKKAIYLDFDIIAKRDLSEMLAIDIEDYYIAGVIAFGCSQKDIMAYHKSIGIIDNSGYMNAGVGIWNLEKIRKNPEIQIQLRDLAKKEFKTNDQDVINLAFYKKNKIIPLKYNFMTKHFNRIKAGDPNVISVYGAENIKEAENSPVIIHYADNRKPWNNIRSHLFTTWWKYALKTPYKYKLILNLLKETLRLSANKIKRHLSFTKTK